MQYLEHRDTELCLASWLQAAKEAMNMNPKLAPARLVLGLAKRER